MQKFVGGFDSNLVIILLSVIICARAAPWNEISRNGRYDGLRYPDENYQGKLRQFFSTNAKD